mmetsp:Transcript_18559/g.21357  ORF Transcript_18559/g.21357 Transcript_18559/m.21357 type:complete len:314 (+) Transcript_18559:51-992(+)|eukprot:CAMPEP_0194382228 /NCGR_PEP_ID=MMETSP0174-20130528/58995_1 /TAXON_ID=216777 /ORGANISM="Proboscia alata, Strain PI-D3" /LENGTH=313 /DNA_ID=CAMNT_0039167359 /DNA_START=35 /DNA_END=976 /DNA_ORIENTATION=-
MMSTAVRAWIAFFATLWLANAFQQQQQQQQKQQQTFAHHLQDNVPSVSTLFASPKESVNSVKTVDESLKSIRVKRSKFARNLIAERFEQELIYDLPSKNPLLIISTDGSTSKKPPGSGTAAILRLVGGNDGVDRVKAVYRRRSAFDQFHEMNAVLNACEAVVQDEELCKKKCMIMILTDCEVVIDFFNPEKPYKYRKVNESKLEKYKLAMARLVDSAAYVRLAKVRSIPSKTIGFFDHQAAHLLSGAARKRKKVTKYAHSWTDVPPLNPHDLHWLKLSDKGKHRDWKSFPMNTTGVFHAKRLSMEFGIDLQMR